MDQATTVRMLSQINAFAGLAYPDLEDVAGICESRRFDRDEILVTEGQLDSAFYVLIDGRLKVVLQRATDSEMEHRATDVQLNELNPGDYFGEYSLIDGQPASASIVAVEPGTLLIISKSAFENFVSGNNRIGRTVYYNLLKLLVKRLRAREDEYDQVMVVD